jgi:DNA-binding NtrC family response regulator
VRELDNAVRYAAMSASGAEVTHKDLPRLGAMSSTEPSVLPQLPKLEGFPLDRLVTALEGEWSNARRLFEKIYISRILEVAGGNQSEAARLAGMSRSAFRDLLKRTHAVDDG